MFLGLGLGLPITRRGFLTPDLERSFDFSAASLPAGATLERASTGTRFNSSGVLVSEAIDAARFDYDPDTLALLGLLVEPQRTNRAIISGAVNALCPAFLGADSWTADASVGPDGNTVMDRLTAVSGNTNHGASGGLTGMTIGQPAAWSLYAKKDTRDTLIVQHFDATFYRFAINLATGAASTPGPFGGAAVDSVGSQDVGGGIYRLWGIRNSMGATAPGIVLYMGFFDPAATSQDSWDVWGTQVEHGTFPTSYIPTAGSAVTRSADVLTLDLADGDWDLEVVTPNGTFTSGSPVTVSGGVGYVFDFADLTGATAETRVLSVTASPA